MHMSSTDECKHRYGGSPVNFDNGRASSFQADMHDLYDVVFCLKRSANREDSNWITPVKYECQYKKHSLELLIAKTWDR